MSAQTTGVRTFELDELKSRKEAKPYTELLRKRSLSLGLYVLPAGGTDAQQPHTADEVYLVLSGRARLSVEGEDHEVRPGMAVSVDHGCEHKFVDITEDLHLLVFLAPPDTPAD